MRKSKLSSVFVLADETKTSHADEFAELFLLLCDSPCPPSCVLPRIDGILGESCFLTAICKFKGWGTKRKKALRLS